MCALSYFIQVFSFSLFFYHIWCLMNSFAFRLMAFRLASCTARNCFRQFDSTKRKRSRSCWHTAQNNFVGRSSFSIGRRRIGAYAGNRFTFTSRFRSKFGGFVGRETVNESGETETQTLSTRLVQHQVINWLRLLAHKQLAGRIRSAKFIVNMPLILTLYLQPRGHPTVWRPLQPIGRSGPVAPASGQIESSRSLHRI